MSINELLLGLPCSCGHTHICDIDFVAIEQDAIRHLSTLTEAHSQILLVADENTWTAAGERTEAVLTGKQLSKVVFSGRTILVPNEDAIAEIEANLGDATLIIGIGSGVIQDLCKYVSREKGVPYIIVATAPSMDGYASTGAAMILGGMKVTVSAGVPKAILADTDVLQNAPMDMIRAGYGDILGKYSALNDWCLSHVVTGEYFCQSVYDLTMDSLKKTLTLADGLVTRDQESVRVLMEALVTVGIAMSFVGSSRPASGSEHHLSHFFEITGIVHNEFYFVHGIDVAYSTVITAKLREQLAAKPWPTTVYRPSRDAYASDMERIYGPVGKGCITLQEQAGFYKRDLSRVYRENETQIREILSQMPSASEIEAALLAVGLDMTEFYRQYTPAKIADAVRYGKDLKDRYSVLWMYYDLFGGELPEEPARIEMPQPLFTGVWGEHHIQGIAVDRKNSLIYYSFTTKLVKATLQGEILGYVTGLVGHLGCIAFCEEDGCVYASLEYKNDIIGSDIRNAENAAEHSRDGFYIARFDVDKIDRMNISAEDSGVMRCAYLSEVVSDYQGTGINAAREIVEHRYGCSGIDGITFGPIPGSKNRQERYLYIAYGVYSDVTRNDNDHQILLCFDPKDIRNSARPLSQKDMHTSGPAAPLHKYFVYTGNTAYGVQNLEYDPYTHAFFMAVYWGEKKEFPNYTLFMVDAAVPARTDTLRGLGETGELLQLTTDGKLDEKTGLYGWYFPHGSTGLCSLGNGEWLISENRETTAGQCGYIFRYVWNRKYPFLTE